MTDINCEDFGNFLKCFLCGRQYREPRLLWCLHSYCESCLTQYINDFRKAAKELQDKSEYNLTCPQCTTEVESTKSDGTKLMTDDFPRNVFTDRLIRHDFGNGMRPGKKTERDVENSQVFTTRKKATNARILSCCESARDQALNKTDTFCVDCDVIVCNICEITDHTEHRCATLQAVSSNFGKKVTNPIQQLTSQIEHLQTKYKTLKENQKEYHSNHQRIQTQIQKQTMILIELVKDYEKFLLKKAEEKHKSAMKDMYNQEQAIAAHISALTSALDFTKMLRQYGRDEEKVSLRKMVGKRLQELCDEQVQYEEIRVKAYTLQKPKVSFQAIGKIYGNLQEEIYTKEVSQKTTPREISREDEAYLQSIGFKQSTQKEYMTGKKNVLKENTTNKHLPVCEPIWETKLPSEISQHCIRGMGINFIGNLVIGASLTHGQAVFIVDGYCGKIMETYRIDDCWTLHTITSTGKGILYLARGYSKFKVKILECTDGIKHLQETQIECVGINTITVDAKNQPIVAANRYIDDTNHSKAIKSDTNVTIFDSLSGAIRQRLTNEMYKNQDIDLLQQPEYLLGCENGDLLVADTRSHSVARLTAEGKVVFNCKVSKSPNLLCIDHVGNILVGDRHEKMLTVLTKDGQAKSFLLTVVPKFFVIGKDRNLLVLDSLGTIRHFKYHQMLK